MSKKTIEPVEQEPKSPREMLIMAKRTMERELTKLYERSQKQVLPMEYVDIKCLVDISKTLVSMDKNEKELPDENEDDDIKNLSDAELTRLAKEIIEQKNDSTQTNNLRTKKRK